MSRAPNEAIYAQVSVNGRNKNRAHRHLMDVVGTDSHGEDSMALTPSHDTARRYHLNDHPTYNDIKVSEKHLGSADWSEYYPAQPQFHQVSTCRDEPLSGQQSAVHVIRSTGRSGDFKTNHSLYSRLVRMLTSTTGPEPISANVFVAVLFTQALFVTAAGRFCRSSRCKLLFIARTAQQNLVLCEHAC